MATNTILVCAPCESRGISLTAIKYCKTCREPLCKVCVECHKSFKATKTHLLVQSVGQNSWKITCDLENFQMCSQHPNKQTEFYCGDHGTLLCSLCLLKSESHKNCAKVIEIDTAGKSFLTTRFTEIVSDTCLKTANTAASAVTEVKKAKDCTSNSLKGLKKEIENIRSKMLQAFDRQSNSILQSVSADLLANTCKCEKALQNLGNLEKGMRESEILFKNVIENGSPADVFRWVKSIFGQCEDFQSEKEQTKRHCLRQNITCEMSDIVHTIEQNPFLFYNVENVALEIADISTDQLKQNFKSGIAVKPTEIVAKNKDKPRFGDRTIESKASHGILPDVSRMGYRTIESKASHGILPYVPRMDDRMVESKASHGILRDVRRMGDRTVESKASHGILPYVPRMVDRTVESKASHGALLSMLSYDSETTSNYSDLDASYFESYSSTEHTPNLDLNVSYCENFEVELSDGQTPWFGGIVCLLDKRLILSDYNNSRIIMVRNKSIVTENNIDFIPGNSNFFQ
ncbi:uncharacterized protein LOC123548076 [Mercenaria mercenaria]|uniref:uncharacterized protein LOC123548076 n=1 Tax=Mercenaria mercenaria TaxID=6596 RepID=UPI00234F3C4B|nr:uncharacterized protein LOC123548076 [Mercenaria mercenaria]XP_053407579.1 uncharacterized protein LOC123548076 [Mercenaria mercenaria]